MRRRGSDRSCIAYQARPFYEQHRDRGGIAEERRIRNGIERIFVEWKIRYSKIIDAQYRCCFPSMDFSKRLWRCRPFPSTIRRNNNRGCKWTRVEPAHETAQGHREQGASRATKCRMNNLSWRRSVHKLCARPTDYRYAHFR